MKIRYKFHGKKISKLLDPVQILKTDFSGQLSCYVKTVKLYHIDKYWKQIAREREKKIVRLIHFRFFFKL